MGRHATELASHLQITVWGQRNRSLALMSATGNQFYFSTMRGNCSFGISKANTGDRMDNGKCNHLLNEDITSRGNGVFLRHVEPPIRGLGEYYDGKDGDQGTVVKEWRLEVSRTIRSPERQSD